MKIRAIATTCLILLSTSCFCERNGVEPLQVQQVCGLTISPGTVLTLKPKHGRTFQITTTDANFVFMNVPDGLYTLSAVFPLEHGRLLTPSHNKFLIEVVGSKTDVECVRPLVVGLSSDAGSDLAVRFQK